MDINLEEENVTQFQSLSLYKNQFQLLKAKQQTFWMMNETYFQDLTVENKFVSQNKALTMKKIDKLDYVIIQISCSLNVTE